MRNLSIIFLFITFLCSCNSNNIEDNGIWVDVSPLKEVVNEEYCIVDGRVYLGTFNKDFYDEVLSKITDQYYIKEVDLSTFKVCQGTCYAKDKNHVYGPISDTCMDTESNGGCVYDDYIIKTASPDSFRYLRNGYAISGRHMYYNGIEIEWRDDILNDSIPITDAMIFKNKSIQTY